MATLLYLRYGYAATYGVPDKKIVEEIQPIQHRAVFSGHVESDSPLHEDDPIRVVAICNHEPDSSFGHLIQRFWEVVGFLARF